MWNDEETALRRAFCIEPDDLTPRLAFADWLAERGRKDEEFSIRAQIEAESLNQANRSEAADSIRATIVAEFGRFENWPTAYLGADCPLLRHYQHFLVGESIREGFNLRLYPGSVFVRLEGRKRTAAGLIFRRGALEAVFLPTLTFLQSAAYLFKYHPIRYVFLMDRRARFVRLLDTEAAERETWTWRASDVPTSELKPEHFLAETAYRQDVGTDFIPRGIIGAGLQSCRFDRYKDATDWLSRRGVAFGRLAAELPPLHDSRLFISVSASPVFWDITDISGPRVATQDESDLEATE